MVISIDVTLFVKENPGILDKNVYKDTTKTSCKVQRDVPNFKIYSTKFWKIALNLNLFIYSFSPRCHALIGYFIHIRDYETMNVVKILYFTLF